MLFHTFGCVVCTQDQQMNKSATNLEARISHLEKSALPSSIEVSEQGGAERGDIKTSMSGADREPQEAAPVLEH
ncbi:hypothetical protein GOP47_0016748 [Adiantum capillus-veneris]|uniref:Uncharacterized protein n=1 Tax=Adiantum capillus-veneris TaxID=13818 RepID=A0A9D4UJ63_ADICA|nr:hypothetical protein GOP47_0016748 [Adiantum capillus-veneris]